MSDEGSEVLVVDVARVRIVDRRVARLPVRIDRCSLRVTSQLPPPWEKAPGKAGGRPVEDKREEYAENKVAHDKWPGRQLTELDLLRPHCSG